MHTIGRKGHHTTSSKQRKHYSGVYQTHLNQMEALLSDPTYKLLTSNLTTKVERMTASLNLGSLHHRGHQEMDPTYGSTAKILWTTKNTLTRCSYEAHSVQHWLTNVCVGQTPSPSVRLSEYLYHIKNSNSSIKMPQISLIYNF
jgi:hypothetical protein